MAEVDYGNILNKSRLVFKDNKELREYYEKMWENGGYSKGFVLNGVPLSQIYHQARQESALRFLEPLEDERILDAGCGDGKLTLEVAKRGGEVYGVDIAQNAFRETQKRSPENANFSQMNLENLAFAEESFDKIVNVETLEHVLYPETALEEFHRVLTPNGKLVLTYPFINTSVMAQLRIALHPERYLEVSEHLTEWSYSLLKRKVESKGFNYIKSEGIVFDLGLLERIKRISKEMTKQVTKIKLSIRGFPRNSTFASFLFEKTEL